MEEIKNNVAKVLSEILEIEFEELLNSLEKPKNEGMGDFAMPCFKFAKKYSKSPVIIAEELKEKISSISISGIEKVEAVSGYLNFFVDNGRIINEILSEIISKKEKYLLSDIGKEKTICIDYSSPNIAKPFHIGHLRSTVIGSSLCKINKALGYNVIGINYLGDFGTQFGYVIEGYNRWKDNYDLSVNPIKQLVEIYVKINELAADDETIKDAARINFKKLEEGDAEVTALWKIFRDLSLEEYKRIYDRLDIKFDSYDGEAYYNDKMGEIIDILESKSVLTLSEGAKVVMLEKGQVPCMILKTNGSTTYATRDLAAILDRKRRYNYEKVLYLTGYEQTLHFSQVFEVAKYIVEDKYIKGLTHVPFGMVLGPGGKKLSTRKGASTTIEDVIDEVIEKARTLLVKKGKVTENVDEVASIIGIGAVIFNDLKNSRIKDEVFDMDEMLKFEGETGPYVQYTYVRTNSILEKASFDVSSIKDVDFKLLDKAEEIELAKLLLKAKEVIKLAGEISEPSVVTRYVIELASAFSKYYNEYQIIVENEKIKEARLCLVYCISIVLKEGLSLLGIKCPKNM